METPPSHFKAEEEKQRKQALRAINLSLSGDAISVKARWFTTKSFIHAWNIPIDRDRDLFYVSICTYVYKILEAVNYSKLVA